MFNATLRNRADLRTLLYALIITGLLIAQWVIGDFQPLLWLFSMTMAVPVAVIAHNHNHLPIWHSKFLNALTDYWLTLFYGYPAFGWIPTHNMNHHFHNNKPEDYTATYRLSEANNLITMLTYPTLSGGVQQRANSRFIADTWRNDRKKAYYYLSQAVLLITYLAVAFVLDWKKALLFIVAPQQFSLFAVLIFNYIQHVHADEESKWNHSRNFVGWFLNAYLFNNGYHTVHHMNPRKHWSEAPAAHRAIEHHIDPALLESSFWGYQFRVYIFGLFIPKLRTQSMRLKRIAASAKASSHSALESRAPAAPAPAEPMASASSFEAGSPA